MTLFKAGYSVYILTSFPSYPSGKVQERRYKYKFFYVETLTPFIIIRIRSLPLSHKGFVNRFFIFSFFVILCFVYIPRILRIVGNIDIVYARAPILFSSLIGLVYARTTKAFFIYEAPDLWPEELVVFKTPFSFAIMRLGKIFARFSYTVPDVIITISSLVQNV